MKKKCLDCKKEFESGPETTQLLNSYSRRSISLTPGRPRPNYANDVIRCDSCAAHLVAQEFVASYSSGRRIDAFNNMLFDALICE